MIRGIAFLALLPVLVLGCQPAGSTPPGETFDAGPVFADMTPMLSHQFKVWNTTGQAVRILGETHSCTCTEVQIPKITLAPGESTQLVMKVRVPAAYSKQMLGCVVKTDHPKFQDWNYNLRYETFAKGIVRSNRVELRLASASASQPGAAPSRHRLTGETWFETYAPAGGALPVMTGVDAVEGLTIEHDSLPLVDTVDGGVQRARYHVRFTTDVGEDGALTGTQSMGLNFRATQGVVVGTTVVWTHDLDVKCEPSRIHFGTASADTPPKRRKLVIRAADGKPLRLLEFIDNDGPARLGGVALPTPPSASHVVDLTLSAPDRTDGRALTGSVRIKTDRGPFPVVQVPWSVFFQRSEPRGARAPDGPARPAPSL